MTAVISIPKTQDDHYILSFEGARFVSPKNDSFENFVKSIDPLLKEDGFDLISSNEVENGVNNIVVSGPFSQKFNYFNQTWS